MTNEERSMWGPVGTDILALDGRGSHVALCVHRTCRREDGIPEGVPL